MTLIRIRRYRVFLAVAIFSLLVVYYYSNSSPWAIGSLYDSSQYDPDGYSPSLDSEKNRLGIPSTAPIQNGNVEAPNVPGEGNRRPVRPETPPARPLDPSTDRPVRPPAEQDEIDAAHNAAIVASSKPTYPPSRHAAAHLPNEEPEDLEPVHWERKPERYPVSSTIQLPTGRPTPIPKIQYTFTGSAGREDKERLDAVKKSMQRMWAGYKKYAWMHDELRPVSNSSKDPFMGWAATLVDSLDTLYIMGMQTEFEEAVKAAGTIDFTTSQARSDIPVFETTIRYLGGLIGAYDISNAAHPILIEKAVELAEILMGAFDTPNRMPVLYYFWEPSRLATQQRASGGSVLAELGSLSVEFTRLAQITKEPKYYDAVARITDALEIAQNKTKLPGMWPHFVDASGCAPQKPLQKASSGSRGPESNSGAGGRAAAGLPASSSAATLPAADDIPPGLAAEKDTSTFGVDRANAVTTDGTSDAAINLQDKDKSSFGEADTAAAVKAKRQLDPTQEPPSNELDCGLKASSDKYTIGAMADSTYEYLPKMHLLLGGVTPQYKTMYENFLKTMEEYLLYRPMIEDPNRKLLFPASYSVNSFAGDSEKADPNRVPGLKDASTGHLQCFVGGMVGLAAKAFSRNAEMDMAEQLTDGCVWAYESTASGIMPEEFRPSMCEDMSTCAWNQTKYFLEVDPAGETRTTIASGTNSNVFSPTEGTNTNVNSPAEGTGNDVFSPAEKTVQELDAVLASEALDAPAVPGAPPTVPEITFDQLEARSMNSLGERQLEETASTSMPGQAPGTDASGASAPGLHTAVTGIGADTSRPASSVNDRQLDTITGTPVEDVDHPLTELFNDSPPKAPIGSPGGGTRTRPQRTAYVPLTHQQYVANRIKTEHLPPGFVSVLHSHYILRPEAIESVFYMYRITGDPVWREKGWAMWQAVERETATPAGSSAIADTGVRGSYKKNDMESFWGAETLKYFYLLFADAEKVSLDEFVLNTEAHPLRRPAAVQA